MEVPTRTDTVGFSASPTLYRLHWNGRVGNEYVHCGADLLLNGLKGDIEAEAKCPVCGSRTQLVLADGKLDGLDPDDAIIHSVEMPTASGRIWIECESTHIFDRKSCFDQWRSKYSGKHGIVASVRDYHQRLIEKRSNKPNLPEQRQEVEK